MKCGTGLLFTGLVILVLAVGLGWFAVPAALKYLILKASRLNPSAQLYETWVEPPPNMDMFLKFYFFNVTNPEDIIRGRAKPILTEMGPYVYKEGRVKVDIEGGTLHGTIQYRQKQFLTLIPELSTGELADKLTFLNFPLVNAGKFAMSLTTDKIVHRMVEEMLIHGRRESLFRRHSVEELLFDGFPVRSFVDLLTDQTLKLVGDVPPLPQNLEDGMLALYEGRNGSDDGIYEVDTGYGDPNHLGTILKWNGETRLPWWRDEQCSRIMGTDGMIFPPFLEKRQMLHAFNPELCRSLQFEFEQEKNVYEVPAWRFILSHQVFASFRTNPENACYCLEEDKSMCDREGFLVMSGCANGDPVLFSKPHFYDADPKYGVAFEGLNPDKEMHESFMDIEPLTATTLEARRRLQMNFEVTAWPTIPYFARLGRNLTFPLMWYEESVALPEMVDKLRLLHFFLQLLNISKWALAFTGILLFLLGIHVQKKEGSSIGTVKQF